MAATVTAPPAPEPGAGVEAIRERGADARGRREDRRRRAAVAEPTADADDEPPAPVAPGRLDVVA